MQTATQNEATGGRPAGCKIERLTRYDSVTAAAAAAAAFTTTTAAAAAAAEAAAAAAAFTTTEAAARTTAAAAAAGSAGSACRTGLGLANGQSAAAAILAVEGLDGLVRASFITHGDEAEAAAAAGVAVADDLGADNGAMGCEHAGELGIIDGPGEIADVEFQGIPRDNWSGML